MHFNLESIIPTTLRPDIDSYITTRTPVAFLSDLPRALKSQKFGCKYNVTVLNAVVLYVGMRAIDMIIDQQQQRVTMSTIAHTACMDIFQYLAVALCTEGKHGGTF
jgi:CCR4-NOT transcription complex subunit 1